MIGVVGRRCGGTDGKQDISQAPFDLETEVKTIAPGSVQGRRLRIAELETGVVHRDAWFIAYEIRLEPGASSTII